MAGSRPQHRARWCQDSLENGTRSSEACVMVLRRGYGYMAAPPAPSSTTNEQLPVYCRLQHRLHPPILPITMLVRQFICGNPLPGPGGNQSFFTLSKYHHFRRRHHPNHGLPPPPSTRLIHDERVWGSFVGFCISWLAHPSYYDDPITPTAALLATAPTAALLHCFDAQYHQHPLPPPPCPKTDGQVMDDECRTKNDHDRRTRPRRSTNNNA
ncbi:hypothetical protein BJ912DRAFT_926190 [Pholiota molesta]|nr:hypothetical protein BJ912DRAFT_926190 [Pholiota molesta]